MDLSAQQQRIFESSFKAGTAVSFPSNADVLEPYVAVGTRQPYPITGTVFSESVERPGFYWVRGPLPKGGLYLVSFAHLTLI